MSFDELAAAIVTPKRKEVPLRVGDKTLTFFANQYSAAQRILLSGMRSTDQDYISQMILFCITDQAGKHMNRDQLNRLPEVIVTEFFLAVCAVNEVGEDPASPKA